MDILSKNQNRRTIPRWRAFTETSKLDELKHHKNPLIYQPDKDRAYQYILSAWNNDKTIENASELLSYAFVINRHNDAKDAAEFILKQPHLRYKSIRQLAERILHIPEDNSKNNNTEYLVASTKYMHYIAAQINTIKSRLKIWPRHPILWADLSRLYTTLGQDNLALKSMRIAINLANNNRFITRAGVRLAIHTHDPEYALKILENNTTYKSDPWLLAAELSVNCILEKPSKLIKKSKEIVDDDKYSHEHISELASAIATVELRYGTSKLARKYFKKSLLCPTENSLAQAEWASLRISSIDTTEMLNIPRSYEANARHAVKNSEWDIVLKNCIRWANDEPFSSTPCAAGSFFSAAIFDDYELALEFCNQGLRANPEDNDIINNKTVCLVHTGNLESAIVTFKKLHDIKGKSSTAISTLATAGLIYYRLGDIENGRLNYEKSIELANEINRDDMAAMAAIYLTKEEQRSSGGNIEKYRNLSNKLIELSKDPIVKTIGNNISNTKFDINKPTFSIHDKLLIEEFKSINLLTPKKL